MSSPTDIEKSEQTANSSVPGTLWSTPPASSQSSRSLSSAFLPTAKQKQNRRALRQSMRSGTSAISNPTFRGPRKTTASTLVSREKGTTVRAASSTASIVETADPVDNLITKLVNAIPPVSEGSEVSQVSEVSAGTTAPSSSADVYRAVVRQQVQTIVDSVREQSSEDGTDFESHLADMLTNITATPVTSIAGSYLLSFGTPERRNGTEPGLGRHQMVIGKH